MFVEPKAYRVKILCLFLAKRSCLFWDRTNLNFWFFSSFAEVTIRKTWILHTHLSTPTHKYLSSHSHWRHPLTWYTLTYGAIQKIRDTFLALFRPPPSPVWHLTVFEHWFLSLFCLELLNALYRKCLLDPNLAITQNFSLPKST